MSAVFSCRSTVALPLKGNEFQANHNSSSMILAVTITVALPLKGNEFQANHNGRQHAWERINTVALPLKGNEFQANHNVPCQKVVNKRLLLYLSKVTNFKQITTTERLTTCPIVLLLYLSKVTNFKQITTRPC